MAATFGKPDGYLVICIEKKVIKHAFSLGTIFAIYIRHKDSKSISDVKQTRME